MYCQSCRTKLSPRDKSCPTCGRRITGNPELGAGTSNEDSGSKSFPLPPAQALDEDSMPDTRPPKEASKEAPAAMEKREGRSERRGRASRKAAASASPSGLGREEILRILIDQPGLVEPGLQVYVDEKGKAIGAGYPTAVGEIDLLARDDSGSWVVIAVAEPDQGKEIVSDLLQRMGWVRRHLGQSGDEVRGIVLLDQMPDDLGYAASAVSDSVEFKLYQMQLTFEAVIL
jgi:hypothetical protein